MPSHDDQTAATVTTIERFNEAFNRHDVDAVMAAMTADCVFESTEPPDGERHEGQPAVRAFWERFFASTPVDAFTTEELIVAGDLAVVRWSFRWAPDGDGPGHVRGVDVIRVRGGQVAEKLSYVKG